MRIKSITKIYPSKAKIIIYNRAVDINPPKCKVHFAVSCSECFVRRTTADPHMSSLQRTRSTIVDLCLANQFDCFATFTFSPAVVDRYNFEQCKSKLHSWLKYQRRLFPDMAYLLVFEQHKDGALHFHALFKNFSPPLSPLRLRKGRQLYNILSYPLGFNTFEYISSISRISTYISKYIKKDVLKLTNKKRYWSSRNLRRPSKVYNSPLSLFINSDCPQLYTYQQPSSSPYFRIYETVDPSILSVNN